MTVGESETWGEEKDGPEADGQAGREAGSRPKGWEEADRSHM